MAESGFAGRYAARLNNADAQERACCINIAAALPVLSCRLETGNRQLCACQV